MYMGVNNLDSKYGTDIYALEMQLWEIYKLECFNFVMQTLPTTWGTTVIKIGILVSDVQYGF